MHLAVTDMKDDAGDCRCRDTMGGVGQIARCRGVYLRTLAAHATRQDAVVDGTWAVTVQG
ncbi:MAG: hypothetical protein BMS9Abin26_0935 [Gammaproteobacteria bacterium]|nr:MAG: hypothetical protein BMS9Abin26_0935 [Gammaproteobacteria bacterium]